MNRAAVLLIAMCFALLSGGWASARDEWEPLVRPARYLSISGQHSLSVDPSTRNGSGPATYVLQQGDKILWTKQLPYTFVEAVVTDDGRAVGYGYSHGYFGWHATTGRYGELVVALLAADGSEVHVERTPRTDDGSRNPPMREPSPRGIFLHPGLKSAVVRGNTPPRQENRGSQDWWLYDLTTGKRTRQLTVPPPSRDERIFHLLVAASAIPGTDLSLVTWFRRRAIPFQTDESGARLSIVDPTGAEIWFHESPTEFNRAGEDLSPWDIAASSLTPEPQFGPQRFVYRSYLEQAVITYTLTKDDMGRWQVQRTAAKPEPVTLGRWSSVRPAASPNVAPFLPAAPVAPAAADPAPLQLKPIGVVTLPAVGDSDSTSRLQAFAFDAAGRIGFVQYTPADDGRRHVQLVRINTTDPSPIGNAQRVTLPVTAEQIIGHAAFAWVGGDRWVVLTSAAGPGPAFGRAVTAFSVNFADGAAQPIANFVASAIDTGPSAASGNQHGFAIIHHRGAGPAVTRFSPDAKPLWSIPAGPFVVGIAMNPAGQLGVLDNSTRQILVFSTAGELVRSIPITAAIGRHPNHLAGLSADPLGGWFVHDFAADPLVWRISDQGTAIAGLTPRFGDGRRFALFGNIQHAPDGALWTSDGAALLRFAADGQVKLVIGRQLSPTTLKTIGAVVVDGADRLYVLDETSVAVHIFNAAGEPLSVRSPLPGDFERGDGPGMLAVAGDGSVYCRPNLFSTNRQSILKFDPAGNREGLQQPRTDSDAEEWFFRPNGQELLVLHHDAASLFDATGQRVKLIERHADRQWLERVDHAAFAPDGAFAILAVNTQPDLAVGPGRSVTLFSADGEPAKIIQLPGVNFGARIALSVRHLAVSHRGYLLLIDRDTWSTRRVDVPGLAKSVDADVFFAAGGRQLWLIDTAAAQVHQFQMP